jgi:hypothetical protein
MDAFMRWLIRDAPSCSYWYHSEERNDGEAKYSFLASSKLSMRRRDLILIKITELSAQYSEGGEPESSWIYG